MSPLAKLEITPILFAIIFVVLPWRYSLAATGSIRVTQPINSGLVPGGRVSQSVLPVIDRVAVTVSHDTAKLAWSSGTPAVSRVSWGVTHDYRDGTVANDQLLVSHEVELKNLLPQTRYYFLITVIDHAGNQTDYAGTFLLLPAPDRLPPQNVTRFVAQAREDKIMLSWQNPSEPDFSQVRIVRSDKFFPMDPLNGQAVYEGVGTDFNDVTISPGKVYYYTAFSRDHAGNYSSGAVAYAMLTWYSESSNLPIPDTSSHPASVSESGQPVVDIKFLHKLGSPQGELSVFQSSQRLQPDHGIVHVDLNLPLLLVLPRDTLTHDISAVTANIENKTIRTTNSTYLFALDPEKRNYIVSIPPLGNPGEFIITVNIFGPARVIAGQLTIKVSASGVINKTAVEEAGTVPMAVGGGILVALLAFVGRLTPRFAEFIRSIG